MQLVMQIFVLACCTLAISQDTVMPLESLILLPSVDPKAPGFELAQVLLVFDETRASVLAERPRNVKRSLVANVAFILHFLGRRMLHIFRKLIKRNSCTIFAVFCFGPAL